MFLHYIMPEHLFFFLGLGFILTHEMDAIRCKEWLMFPLTFFLKDETVCVKGCFTPLVRSLEHSN